MEETLLSHTFRAGHPLVALTPFQDLFICAKQLLIDANGASQAKATHHVVALCLSGSIIDRARLLSIN
jgi:hypothetical protein